MGNHLFDGLFKSSDAKKPLVYLDEGRIFTYRDALEASARLANVLVGLDVKPGERVGVQVEKSIEAVMLYLACIRIGAIFLPLNTAYGATEVDYFLGDAGICLFVCDPEAGDKLAPVATKNGANLVTLGSFITGKNSQGTLSMKAIGSKAVSAASTNFENLNCDGDSLAAILYTSGTTGRSKGAMLSHANLLSNAQTLAALWHFTSDDVLLHALPIFHTHGLFVAINVTLVAGSAMIFLPEFSSQSIIENLPNSTIMMGVPTFYTRLLNDPKFNRPIANHMRLFICGSAPLLDETHVEFTKRTGKIILERYGMTETNMNTSNPYEGERKAGSVGFPLPGVSVRICDGASGKMVKQGGIGVIEVKGPNVFSGYWKMPEKNAEEFRPDGHFITGDLGCIDDEGYLHIVGRSKDMIISGGLNIYPKEVEGVLDEHADVVESAVIGVSHPDFGEGVVGIVVALDGYSDCENILNSIGDKLARFKQPKVLKIVEELPRNTMGKVQKNILREEYADIFS